jgi:hypothetical protein
MKFRKQREQPFGIADRAARSETSNGASLAPGFPMFPPHRRERAVISVFRRKTVRSELCGHIECVQGDGEEHLLVEGNGSIPDQPREISSDGCTGLATEAYYSPSMQLLRC